MWAAEGRGLLAAWETAALIARMPLTAASLNPSEINPFRLGSGKSAAMAELEKWQASRAWRKAHAPKGR